MEIFLRSLLVLFLFTLFLYWVGPRPPKPVFDNRLKPIEANLHSLEPYIREKEEGLPIKPENESKIIWDNDSLKEKTRYCLLYLHGFSASAYEGFPTHLNWARHFGANLYLPRLAAHGLDDAEPLLDMTPDRLYESAKEALQVARLLGEKVIIMSTSTGGTLSLKLAAEFPEMVDGLLLMSPNVKINNALAFLLSKPWGLQIARKTFGGKYRYINENPEDPECDYWNCYYRLEATVYLQQLVEATMTNKLFRKVKIPVFLGYYYQDKNHQDEVVRVDAMLDMFDKLGTPDSLKRKQAFHAGVHVIGCEMFSKTQAEVEKAMVEFAENYF
ncbi:alpha/beta hydrolase [Gaoshiqia sp. Z1-71]|uniref:alpha/beta hydrolase n=1 Tax=Gaoshiqia hydrogeniformans TaxID=3290090 RepID=UPI003BF8B9CC